ncbi:MAG: nucleotidyltransferase domain-containing protein, partial [Rhodospirillales bacterium]|nr:nucleotidyltransferase domain-containing protein [Rhodospirillales bacterium]
MRKSNFALRLQPSLLAEARRLAAAEGVAVNQLINVAVAEKLAVARAERRLAGPAPDRERIVRLLRDREEEIRAKGVTRLALVGSVARGDATPASDVDLLVDIAPGRKFSLIDHSGLRLYFQDLI